MCNIIVVINIIIVIIITTTTTISVIVGPTRVQLACLVSIFHNFFPLKS